MSCISWLSDLVHELASLPNKLGQIQLSSAFSQHWPSHLMLNLVLGPWNEPKVAGLKVLTEETHVRYTEEQAQFILHLPPFLSPYRSLPESLLSVCWNILYMLPATRKYYNLPSHGDFQLNSTTPTRWISQFLASPWKEIKHENKVFVF